MARHSSSSKSKFLTSSTGFSLVEIMIVIVIIGIFVTYGARKIGGRSNDVKTQIRKFSVITKKLRDRARLDNATYRLVFDLPADSKKEQSYWIESTSKSALLLSEEQREDLEDDVEDVKGKDGEKITPDPQGFVTDSQVLKNGPTQLPKGLYFDSIEIMGDPIEELSEGRIYIYFFPQGYVQGSAIHITDRDKLNWTLVIHGLTGRMDIFQEDRPLEDFKTE